MLQCICKDILSVQKVEFYSLYEYYCQNPMIFFLFENPNVLILTPAQTSDKPETQPLTLSSVFLSAVLSFSSLEA